MQASNHRNFNIVIAIDFLLTHTRNIGTAIIIGLGIILASSLPDRIEKIGLKHRGISHSLIFYTLLGLLLNFYLKIYSYMEIECLFLGGIIAGSLIHVLIDMFSKHGITVLGIPIKFGLYTTGGMSEYIFLWICITLNFGLLYKFYPNF